MITDQALRRSLPAHCGGATTQKRKKEPNIRSREHGRAGKPDQSDSERGRCPPVSGRALPDEPLQKKHMLFSMGSSPMALYFICKGKIKLSQHNAAGNEYITTLCGEGDFLGYLALLEEVQYTETAEVIEDAEVVVIPKADFMRLIFQNQEVANQFIRMLAADVAEHQQRLLKLAYQSVRKRVAEALIMYQRKFYGQADETADALPINQSPPMTLSRENWSHLVGASTETVIRVLSDLRAEGLIDIKDSQITLLNIEKLTRLKR